MKNSIKGIGKKLQNGQTEPTKPIYGLCWVTRRRTASKQSRHRSCFAIVAKHTLNALLFLLPKKHGLLFGVPESRKTFGERSKRATSLSFRKLKPKRALRRGEAKFVRSKKAQKKKNRIKIRFFNKNTKFVNCYNICVFDFNCLFAVWSFFTSLFIYPQDIS